MASSCWIFPPSPPLTNSRAICHTYQVWQIQKLHFLTLFRCYLIVTYVIVHCIHFFCVWNSSQCVCVGLFYCWKQYMTMRLVNGYHSRFDNISCCNIIWHDTFQQTSLHVSALNLSKILLMHYSTPPTCLT